MRTPFIAANWKMYKTVHEAVAFIKEFRKLADAIHDVEIVIAPPFTALHAAVEAAHGSNIGIAGQNLHWEREGAYTGEISGGMLKSAGAEYVIIGHSERRRHCGATDHMVNRALLSALAAQLTGIVCIGETLEERDASQTLDRPRSADQGGARRPQRPIRSRPWSSRTSRCGRSAPAATRRPRRRPTRTRTSAAGCASGSAAPPPSRATSSTAAASSLDNIRESTGARRRRRRARRRRQPRRPQLLRDRHPLPR